MVNLLQVVVTFIRNKQVKFSITQAKREKFQVKFSLKGNENEIIVDKAKKLLLWKYIFKPSSDLSLQTMNIGRIIKGGEYWIFVISQFMPWETLQINEWLDLVFSELSNCQFL